MRSSMGAFASMYILTCRKYASSNSLMSLFARLRSFLSIRFIPRMKIALKCLQMILKSVSPITASISS